MLCALASCEQVPFVYCTWNLKHWMTAQSDSTFHDIVGVALWELESADISRLSSQEWLNNAAFVPGLWEH
jgi:hypothetical protein